MRITALNSFALVVRQKFSLLAFSSCNPLTARHKVPLKPHSLLRLFGSLCNKNFQRQGQYRLQQMRYTETFMVQVVPNIQSIQVTFESDARQCLSKDSPSCLGIRAFHKCKPMQAYENEKCAHVCASHKHALVRAIINHTNQPQDYITTYLWHRTFKKYLTFKEITSLCCNKEMTCLDLQIPKIKHLNYHSQAHVIRPKTQHNNPAENNLFIKTRSDLSFSKHEYV